MTYSQRGRSEAGASSDIAHLEYRIDELNDRVRRLAEEIATSPIRGDERISDLRAELEQARNELKRLEDELAAYED